MSFIDFCLIAPTKKELKLSMVLLNDFWPWYHLPEQKINKKYNCWVTNHQNILVRNLYGMLYSHLTSLQNANNRYKCKRIYKYFWIIFMYISLPHRRAEIYSQTWSHSLAFSCLLAH